MPGRKYSAGTGYRYGFNGKENDNEVKGESSQQDYGMRIYDPRIGKFLSVDPISSKYPELTPYQFASDRPIDGVDEDGLEWAKGRDPIDRFWRGDGDQVTNLLDIISDAWYGTGKTGDGLDYVNRNYNPIGIAAHDGYQIATGKDMITGESKSREKATEHLVLNVILYVTFEKATASVTMETAEAKMSMGVKTALQSSKPQISKPSNRFNALSFIQGLLGGGTKKLPSAGAAIEESEIVFSKVQT